MVRHWTLTPASQGSNPCGPAKSSWKIPRAFFHMLTLIGEKRRGICQEK